MMEGLQPYPEYKDSGVPFINEIPKHWDVFRGKYIFDCVDVRSVTGDEELLTVSAHDGVLPRSQKNVTMFMAESYIGHKLCWPGDLVINSLWAWMRGFGFSKYYGIVSSAYGVYRPNLRYKSYWQYFHYLLRSNAYDWEFRVRSKGIWVSRYQLLDEAFLDMPIICPPLDEAEGIVKFVKICDRKIKEYIEAKKRQISLLNEQKQAIIHQAVTRGLDPSVPMKPSGIEWLGEIPEHWDIIPIKRVLKRLIDTEHKTAPAVDGGKYPVIRTSNIKNGKLIFDDIYYTDEKGYSEWTRRGKPLPGELLFTREAPAGEACIVPDGIDLCMGQRVVLLGVDSQKINSEFLLLSLNSGVSKDYIKNKSVGSTVPHFNMADIATIPILVPPLPEQLIIVQEIGLKTHSYDTIINKTNNEVLIIKEYRTRLIIDVVTGKLDIRSFAATLPDADDIPLDIPTEEEPEEEYTDEEE